MSTAAYEGVGTKHGGGCTRPTRRAPPLGCHAVYAYVITEHVDVALTSRRDRSP